MCFSLCLFICVCGGGGLLLAPSSVWKAGDLGSRGQGVRLCPSGRLTVTSKHPALAQDHHGGTEWDVTMDIELVSTGPIPLRTGISEEGLLGLDSEDKEQQERVEGMYKEKEEAWQPAVPPEALEPVSGQRDLQSPAFVRMDIWRDSRYISRYSVTHSKRQVRMRIRQKRYYGCWVTRGA